MSFSSEMRTELMTLTAQKKCCRRALALGLLYDAETDGERGLATYSSIQTAQYAQKIIDTAFGGESAPMPPVGVGKGVFDLAIGSARVAALIGAADTPGACSECRIAFLRGVLVALSSLTDPARQYHLEMLLKHPERAAELSDILTELFGRPLTVVRRSGTGLVYKNSSVIEDILSSVGATQTYFDFLNKKIERDLRNNANRATNCETRNIARAVAASKRQIDAVDALEAAGELDTLPAELRETAELRRLYPDMPLAELGARHCPPISKSGINHRIAKLIEAADKLKK